MQSTVTLATPNGRRLRLPPVPWPTVRLWTARALALALVLTGLGWHASRLAAAVGENPMAKACIGEDPCTAGCRTCTSCAWCKKHPEKPCGVLKRLQKPKPR